MVEIKYESKPGFRRRLAVFVMSHLMTCKDNAERARKLDTEEKEITNLRGLALDRSVYYQTRYCIQTLVDFSAALAPFRVLVGESETPEEIKTTNLNLHLDLYLFIRKYYKDSRLRYSDLALQWGVSLEFVKKLLIKPSNPNWQDNRASLPVLLDFLRDHLPVVIEIR